MAQWELKALANLERYMPRYRYFLVFQFLLAWTVGCGTEQNPKQGYSRPEVHKHLRALVANLPADNWERRIVENGRSGDGVRTDLLRKAGARYRTSPT